VNVDAKQRTSTSRIGDRLLRTMLQESRVLECCLNASVSPRGQLGVHSSSNYEEFVRTEYYITAGLPRGVLESE
jgi:hypothetical protein